MNLVAHDIERAADAVRTAIADAAHKHLGHIGRRFEED